jgi:2-hydroxy-6-oxonona-2,4-dienedioate hydrolase
VTGVHPEVSAAMASPPSAGPAPSGPGEAVPAYAGMPPGQWVDVDGVRTWYTEHGDGAPVLLIHGGHAGAPYCLGASCWSGQFASVPGSVRLMALDRPGQGHTANPLRLDEYTLETSVDHAIRFIETMGLAPVHLVGHSRGGYIVTRVALRRPDLVRSVTIVQSSTLAPGVGTTESTLARPARPLTRESVRWYFEHYFHDSAHVTEDEIETCHQLTTADKYQELLRDFAPRHHLLTTLNPDLAARKQQTLAALSEGRLQRPVQLVWALNDPTARADRGIELFQLIRRHERRTTFSMVNGSSHFPFVEQAAWFNSALFNFVQEVDNALY